MPLQDRNYIHWTQRIMCLDSSCSENLSLETHLTVQGCQISSFVALASMVVLNVKCKNVSDNSNRDIVFSLQLCLTAFFTWTINKTAVAAFIIESVHQINPVISEFAVTTCKASNRKYPCKLTA